MLIRASSWLWLETHFTRFTCVSVCPLQKARMQDQGGIAPVHWYAFPERLEDPVLPRVGKIDRGREIAQ